MKPQGMTQPKVSPLPVPPSGRPPCALADAVGVRIVNVLLAGAPLGVTVDGVKVQVVPFGKPEQTRLIGKLKPFSGISVTPTVDG